MSNVQGPGRHSSYRRSETPFRRTFGKTKGQVLEYQRCIGNHSARSSQSDVFFYDGTIRSLVETTSVPPRYLHVICQLHRGERWFFTATACQAPKKEKEKETRRNVSVIKDVNSLGGQLKNTVSIIKDVMPRFIKCRTWAVLMDDLIC